MGMRLRMVAGIETRMMMRCSTCKQAIDSNPDPEATRDVNLLGAAKYVVCPTCNQVVSEDLRTPAYKTLWTKKRRLRK